MIPYWSPDKLFEIRGAYDAHGKNATEITIGYTASGHLSSCLCLPGLLSERSGQGMTAEYRRLFRNTLHNAILRESLLCALDQNTVVGLPLFSPHENRLCCPAVHPGYRRQNIASQMIAARLGGWI